jgi:hypothetical protein
MFESLSHSAIEIIEEAKAQATRLQAASCGSEHLLYGLAGEKTGIAHQALITLKVSQEQIGRELEAMQPNRLAQVLRQANKATQGTPAEPKVAFSEELLLVLGAADDQRRYYGAKKLLPEHLLLGICEVNEIRAGKVLEEFGANIVFLRGQTIDLMAKRYLAEQKAPTLSSAICTGLSELISKNLEAAEALKLLSERSQSHLHPLPESKNVVHMVFVGYLQEFLSVQVQFQRYLLQQSIRLLTERTGSLDDEVVASIVSASAQHLRLEARYTIEFLWTHEYRLLSQVLDEAEHDLIGSAIEDLFWAHSEELALHELYDTALQDHRRKQVLASQKRRLEIQSRIKRLRSRLGETLKQCFLQKPMSA